jgi:hypothetical protein
MGRARTSPLAPLLRSDALGRVLAAIVLNPESMHLRAISDRTQLPYSVVQREVDRLERDHLVKSTRFATARVVRPNIDHPLFPELRALLLKAFGPREVLSCLRTSPGSSRHMSTAHGARVTRTKTVCQDDQEATTGGDSLMTFDEMLRNGELERVEPDEDACVSALEEARRHIDSARAIASTDPNGAYQLAYDAARKAVVGNMRRSGVRVRRGEGARALTALYASGAMEEELGMRLDQMRRRRNRSE